METATLLLPLELNAFALNERCCDNGQHYRIAPITQPNYTFLRLHDNLIVPDVLDHVDLHSVTPSNLNSRLTDLGSGALRQNRLGVYLHWTLPQLYRSGQATAAGTAGDATTRKLQQGYPTTAKSKPAYNATTDTTMPDFRPMPNRWAVIRRLVQKTPSEASVPDFQAWIIESDRLSKLDDSDMPQDIEFERSPFINPHDLDPKGGRVIEGQAEEFLGRSTPAGQWNLNQAEALDPSFRADLTVLASSNPLFADFQPHNTNVLSFVDNFKYTDKDGNMQYLTTAECDYFVIGWHSNSDHDPLTTDPDTLKAMLASTDPKLANYCNADRLDHCDMELKDKSDQAAKDWLSSRAACRVLCHSAMYDVKYNKASLPTIVQAEAAGKQLSQVHPIAVGASPLDALLAYCRAHSTTDPKALASLETDILRLGSLLQATESDDVDGLQAAADENYEQAFTKFDGGTLWHYHQETDPDGRPSDPEIGDLASLNQAQELLSNSQREASNVKWTLFALWWNYVSGLGLKLNKQQFENDSQLVRDSIKRLADITARQTQLSQSIMKPLQTTLTNTAAKKQPQQGTNERFYQRKDPTILFGGIQSGFADDFSNTLQVRLQGQAVVPSTTDFPEWPTFKTFLDGPTTLDGNKLPHGLVGQLPSELQGGIRRLCQEFYQLRSGNASMTKTALPQVIPIFHDEIDPRTGRNDIRGRDLWSGSQPWKPLFIEWEAIYYHVPFDKWKMKESPRHSHWGANVLHYGFDEDISAAKISDTRTLSGRVVLLPQTQSSLSTLIRQIINNTNPDDLTHRYSLSPSEQNNLLRNVSELDFVSSPLTGLTSGLLTTLTGGMHVKPTVHLPNASPLVIQSAADASTPFGITADVLASIGAESTSVPYGSSVALYDTYGPMKLATHGQLMFTKLNVVDKFGQAICAIDPALRDRSAPIPTVSPCLSDTHFPGTVNDADPSDSKARANTVIRASDNNACPFVQLTPAINQPARLNASFVHKVSGKWKITSEWENNAIWGWLVINYPEQGLQIYQADGTFYREVRKGGISDTEASLKWLPFDPPSGSTPSTQLDALIQCLRDPDYLQCFFDTINDSTGQNTAHPPDAYATYSSAIIGKPLALVNFGLSLELAGKENLNWSRVNLSDTDRHLLKPNGDSFAPGDPGSYTFPVKIGDRDRTFDGLLGYFPAAKKPSASSPSDLDLSQFFTYYYSDKPSTSDPRKPLKPGNGSYPLFTPYYDRVGNANDPIPDPAAHMTVFGALLDPFLPIHAYSSILPNKTLQLPAWTWQDALSKITAFWRVGPLIVTDDMPPSYDPTRAVTANSLVPAKVDPKALPPKVLVPANVDKVDPTTMEPKVAIPVKAPVAAKGGPGAEFHFLQPYPGQDSATPRYNAFRISADAASGADAATARFAPGPYTAVEGYLHLVKQAQTQSS